MLKSVGVIYIIRCLFIILSLNYASISMADSCHQNYKQAVKQQQLKNIQQLLVIMPMLLKPVSFMPKRNISLDNCIIISNR